MLLSARILNNCTDVNHYTVDDSARFTEGDGPTIYFQLIDSSLDRDASPPGRRYMPAVGATLSVFLGSIDNLKQVTRFASQPFPLDPSIWSLTLLATDPVRGSMDMKLTLVQGGVTTTGFVRQAIAASPLVQSRV